jgi:FSR family fosmidomycin resistance protein-like MFS transporter
MNPSYKGLYGTLFLLWIGHFFVDFMIGIWPVYKTLAHLDLAKAGLISAACAFIGEGLQVVFGSLSDRGWRVWLIMGGIIAAAANSLLAYTQDYFLLFCLFLTVCIGSGAFHPSAVGLVGNLIAERRGFLITIFTSGGSLGLASSQLIYTHAHFVLSGETVWLIVPFVCLAICIFVIGLKSTQTEAPKHKGINLKQYITLFKNKDLRGLYIVQVCNQSVFWALVFLLPDVLVCREYESWLCFGGGHLFLILGGAVMMVPAGYLADKFSPRKVMLYGTIFGMIFFYSLLFYPVLPASALLTLLFFVGATIGMLTPVLVSFGIRLLPSQPGTVSAFLLGLAWCVSEGLGQGGGGLLTKVFVDDAPAKALIVLGIFFIVGIFFIYRLPETDSSEKRVDYAPQNSV